MQKLNEARGKREESLSSKTLAQVAQDQSEQEASRHFSNEQFDGELLQNQQRFYEGSSSSSSSGLQDRRSQQSWEKRGIRCVPREKSKWTQFLDDNDN